VARDRALDRIVQSYEQCIPEHETGEPHMCGRLGVELCERCNGTGDGIGWDEWECVDCRGTGLA
jgi:hypothetical protein